MVVTSVQTMYVETIAVQNVSFLVLIHLLKGVQGHPQDSQ